MKAIPNYMYPLRHKMSLHINYKGPSSGLNPKGVPAYSMTCVLFSKPCMHGQKFIQNEVLLYYMYMYNVMYGQLHCVGEKTCRAPVAQG